MPRPVVPLAAILTPESPPLPPLTTAVIGIIIRVNVPYRHPLPHPAHNVVVILVIVSIVVPALSHLIRVMDTPRR